MAGFVLADVEWTDDQGRARYVELLSPVLARFHGEVVAAARDVRVEEGDWNPRGILILIRFPSLSQASAWYESADYQPALQVRREGARSRLLIFEGE